MKIPANSSSLKKIKENVKILILHQILAIRTHSISFYDMHKVIHI